MAVQDAGTGTERAPTPVGVLVGFLGSGKTTTLNRLLRGTHGKRIAVVVNEFGEVDVDNELVTREIRADAELISLVNACICCKLRGDLLSAVEDLSTRFDLDYILVESTCLGEAAPIAQTFFAPTLAGKVRLDAVRVTQLVFTGRGVDQERLIEALDACQMVPASTGASSIASPATTDTLSLPAREELVLAAG